MCISASSLLPARYRGLRGFLGWGRSELGGGYGRQTKEITCLKRVGSSWGPCVLGMCGPGSFREFVHSVYCKLAISGVIAPG